MKQRFALALMVISLLGSLFAIPSASWREAPFDPCHLGVILGGAVVATLTVTAFAGAGGARIERPLLAIFLGGMPLPYVLHLVWYGGSSRWLAIELAALPIYGGIALAGLRGSPLVLAAGIAAHGILWDGWHLANTPMPGWYALGCLLVDVTLALYVVVRNSPEIVATRRKPRLLN